MNLSLTKSRTETMTEWRVRLRKMGVSETYIIDLELRTNGTHARPWAQLDNDYQTTNINLAMVRKNAWLEEASCI